jgi:two-component system, response regulator YesN
MGVSLMELKILIVDDELLIRNGIARKVQALFPDIEIVGKSGDADEALDMIKNYHPQIVITDIRMPEVDGLQFINQAKKLHNNIKFIIISGYQDFEYARTALRLGVQDYLLKPVDNTQLKNIVDKIKIQLEEEVLNKSVLSALKDSVTTNLEFLKNKYLTDLIETDSEQDAKQIIKNLELLDIKFNLSCYTIMTLVISEAEATHFTKIDNGQYLEKYAISNIIEELLFSLGYVVSFENLRYNNQLVIIINHEDKLDFNVSSRLYMILHTALHTIKKLFKFSAAIGISNEYSKIKHSPVAYCEAYTAAMQKILLGDNKVTHASTLSQSNRLTFFLPEGKKLILLNYIKEAKSKKANEIIDEIFTHMNIDSLSYFNVKTLYIELIILFSKIIKESGGSFEKIFSEDLFSETYLLKFNSLNSLYLWLKDCVIKICDYINELRKSSGKKTIEAIIKFIDDYYYMDINLNDLASKYYINPNYLSQLFKNEININFIDYLTQIRIEKAKNLLKDTDLASYKVSELVGYGNSRYFSDVFSKHVGNTPTKYREQFKNNLKNTAP